VSAIGLEDEKRRQEAQRGEAHARTVACPVSTCNAAVGASCVTASGHKRHYHTGRVVYAFRAHKVDGGHTPSNPWGKLYGATPCYLTTDGRQVWMHRKGQAVRFYDADGWQVGPEQTNVAPAVAFAIAADWRNLHVPAWLDEQGRRDTHEANARKGKS
jgi:hypothetical protein